MRALAMSLSALFACWVGVFLAALRIDYLVDRELCLVRWTGWLTLIFLTLALSATPLGRLFGRRVTAIRRAFGISTGAAGLVHLAVTASTPMLTELGTLITEPQLRSGASSLLILLLLTATSFGPVIGSLSIRRWRALHQLAYVAGALSLHHAALSPHSELSWLAIVLVVLVLGLLLRGLPRRSEVARTESARVA